MAGDAIQPESSAERSFFQSSPGDVGVVTDAVRSASFLLAVSTWIRLCGGLVCSGGLLLPPDGTLSAAVAVGLVAEAAAEDDDLKCWIQFFCFSMSSLLEMRVFSTVTGLAGSSGL